MDDDFPSYAVRVLKKLKSAGFDSYFVGGCVRDMLLSRKCADYDIATAASPNQIMSLFAKTYPIGAAFGTISVFYYGKKVEVTTFRQEEGTKDRRHPQKVAFGVGILQDLKRRDFTINSMACDEHKKILDPYGGLCDLQNKLIRCTGNPDDRFREDALRMIRGVRFCATLGFTLHEDTWRSLLENVHLTQYISRERIKDEFDKIICAKDLRYAVWIFAWQLILPDKKVDTETVEKIIARLEKVDGFCKKDYLTRLFLILYCLNEEGVITLKGFLTDYRYSNATQKNMLAMAEMVNDARFDRVGVKHMLSHYPKEIVKKAMKAGCYLGLSKNDGRIVENIIKSGECFYIQDLQISGKDLIKMGYYKQEIQKGLDYALSLCIDNPSLNDRDTLLKILSNKKGHEI